MPDHPVFRFAPSPNGWLHAGHARSALLNRRFADRLGGTMLLRIEDIDLARTREAYVEGIREDLAWLGLRWPEPPLRQSARFAAYGAAAGRLFAMGLLYPCTCSRGDIRRTWERRPEAGLSPPRDPDGSPLYPGTCRPAAGAREGRRPGDGGDPVAWRLDMAAALRERPAPAAWRVFDDALATRTRTGDPAVWGDVVLLRKDFPASYHIAVVVDDAEQQVTHVVRGRDLEAATPLHRLLQDLLGLPAPAYHHHALLVGGDGLKLAKSRGSPALRDLRAAGLSPRDVALAALAGGDAATVGTGDAG
jgi:glutamyl-Q tRNA(Asp) synthetase